MPDTLKYAKRLVKGTSILFAGMVGGSLAGFFLRIFLTRSLDAFSYGLFFSVLAFTSFVGLAQIAGFSPAIAKHLAEFLARREEGKAKSCIVLGLVLWLIPTLSLSSGLMIFADPIALWVFGTGEASLLLRVIAVDMILSSILVAIQSTYQGLQNMKVVSLLDFSKKLCVFAFSVLLMTYVGLRAEGVALAYVCGSIVCLGWGAPLLLRLLKKLGGEISLTEDLAKIMFRFALLATIGMIGAAILDYTDTLTIQVFLGAEEVGYYQAARPLCIFVAGIGGAIGAAFLPMVSELWAKENKQGIQNLTYHMLRLSFAVMMPIAFILAAFPELVIRLLFTEAFLQAAPALVVLAPLPMLYVPWMYLTSALGGIGRPEKSTQAILVIATLNLIGNLLLVPWLGIVGAAITTLLAYVIGFGMACSFVSRYLEVKIPLTQIGKCTVGGILTLLLILGLRHLLELPVWSELALIVGTSMLFYLTWLWITRVVGREDVRLLGAILRR